MDNNRLHLLVKICMVILLLVLAYVLPGVCARRAGQPERQQTRIESGPAYIEAKGIIPAAFAYILVNIRSV